MSTLTISLDMDYLRSRKGLLRVAEAVIALIGITCLSQYAYCRSGGMFIFHMFVVVVTVFRAAIIFIVCATRSDKICTVINRSVSIFVTDVLFSIMYLIATILMIITMDFCHGRPGEMARYFASVFGLFGTLVVVLLAVMGYQTLQEGKQSAPALQDAVVYSPPVCSPPEYSVAVNTVNAAQQDKSRNPELQVLFTVKILNNIDDS